ncbi:unnamed protein product [Parnassius mnemosyne]|uniref:Uncharacterized protein n=1 Tax=Parnassius mnemosyne TaxID=213953 RepID=A0AAV1LLW4_9NEOP
MQPREDYCLIKIENFFKREAELCGPYALPEQMTPPTTAAPQRKTQRINNVTEKKHISRCVVCEDTGHTNATECEQFKKLDANARWDMAKSKRLCTADSSHVKSTAASTLTTKCCTTKKSQKIQKQKKIKRQQSSSTQLGPSRSNRI